MGGSGEGGNTSIGAINPVVNSKEKRKREKKKRGTRVPRKLKLLKIQGWQPPSSQSGWRTI